MHECAIDPHTLLAYTHSEQAAQTHGLGGPAASGSKAKVAAQKEQQKLDRELGQVSAYMASKYGKGLATGAEADKRPPTNAECACLRPSLAQPFLSAPVSSRLSDQRHVCLPRPSPKDTEEDPSAAGGHSRKRIRL